MSKLTIFGHVESTYTQTVLMALADKRIDHDFLSVEFKTDALAQNHPYSKVPVVEQNGLSTFETLAILGLLDSIQPEPLLLPTSPPASILTLQWASVMTSYIYPGVVLPEGPETIASARSQLQPLEHALSKTSHFSGEEASAADYLLAPMLHYATGVRGPALLDGFPALQTWFLNMHIQEKYPFMA